MRSKFLLASVGMALLAGCNVQPSSQPSQPTYGIDPVVLTDQNFEEVVLASSGVVMVDCGAPW